MKFIAISDVHGKVGDISRLRDHGEDKDLIVISGDLTQFGSGEVAKELIKKIFETNKNVLAVPGNCDRTSVLKAYEDHGISLHGKGKIIKDIGFFGVGGSSATPFDTPFELAEEEILEIIHKGYEKVKGCKTKVLVSHSPPYNTKVDKTGEGLHIGSRAVRDFILDNQPDLVICGHAHEARGRDKLGNALIINPGPLHMGFAIVSMTPKIDAEFVNW